VQHSSFQQAFRERLCRCDRYEREVAAALSGKPHMRCQVAIHPVQAKSKRYWPEILLLHGFQEFKL
jgi:hypothetical protein